MKPPAVGVIVVAVFIAGCSGTPSQDSTSETPAPSTSESSTPSPSESAGPNDADLRVVRVIEGRGARVDAAAARLFRGSADLTAATWRESAPIRNDIAAGLLRDAAALGSELSGLSPQVHLSGAAVNWGVYAFYQLGLCGRQAAAFFSEAESGSATEAAGQKARSTCNGAREAYAKAKRKAKAMPRTAAPQPDPSAS